MTLDNDVKNFLLLKTLCDSLFCSVVAPQHALFFNVAHDLSGKELLVQDVAFKTYKGKFELNCEEEFFSFILVENSVAKTLHCFQEISQTIFVQISEIFFLIIHDVLCDEIDYGFSVLQNERSYQIIKRSSYEWYELRKKIGFY